MTYVPDYVRPVGPKSPVSGPTTPTTPGHNHRRVESYTSNGTRSAPSSGVRDRTTSHPRLSDDVISSSIASQRRRSASNPASYTPSRPFKPPQDRLCARMSIKDRLKSLESEAAVKLEVRHTSQRRQRRSQSHGSQRISGSDKDRQSEDNSSISSVNSIRTTGDTPEKMLETVAPMPKPDIIASNQPKFDVLPSKILPETDPETKQSKIITKKVSKLTEEKKTRVKKGRNDDTRIGETPKPKAREKIPKHECNVPKYEKLAVGDKKPKKSADKHEEKEQILKSEDSEEKSTEYCSIDNKITNVPETILPNLATERLHEQPPETGSEVTKTRLSNENLTEDSKSESAKGKGSNGPAFRPIWRTPSIKQGRGSRKNSTDDKASDTKEEQDLPNENASETPLENQIEPTPQLRPGFDKEQEQIDATVTLAELIIASKVEIEGSAFAKQPDSSTLDESIKVTATASVSNTTSNDVNIVATTYPVELRSPRHEHSGQAIRRQNTRDKRNARVFVVPSSSDSDMDNSNQLSRMERDFAKLGLSRAVDLLPQSTLTSDNNNHNPPKMDMPEITIKHVPPVKFVPNLLKGNSKDSEKEEKKKVADEQSAKIYPELLAPSRSSKKESKSHDGEGKKESQKSPNRRRKSTRSGRSGSSRSKSTDARKAGRDVQRNRSNSMCDPQRIRSGQEAVANAVAFGTSNGTAIPYIDDAVSPVEENYNETAKARKSSSADEKKGQERASIHRSNSADVLSSLVPETSPAKMRRARASSVDRSTAKGVHRRSYQIATMAHDCDPAYQQNLDKLNKLLMQADDDESRDSSLGDQDAMTRNGYLHFKVATIDKGRRTSSQKSWKLVWAMLKDQQLSLSKDVTKSKGLQDSPLERQASLPEDVQSLNVQSSLVGIAYNYLKRRNVFKLTTFNGSEYLFQAVDRNDMLAWISAIQKQSYMWDDGTEGISEDLILRKTNQIDPGPKSDKRNNRKRSPKPSQKNTLQAKDVDGSRRFKWRGSVNKIVKKFGTGQPFILNGTFGVHLEDCPPSAINEFVPFIVELCCRIVEDRGLHFTGIYRVPGNNAALSALQEDLNNHGVESIHADDERLRDLNIVSSLLKSFFRKLPEPMFTNELYHDFILANRSPTPENRLNSLRKLVHMLPGPHYETLKFLISHLRLVADNCESNKMEVRNLAIVFGPTLVRNTAADNTTTMVTDMSDQCRIIESIIDHADWFFSDTFDPAPETATTTVPVEREHEAVPSIEFLLGNVGRKPGDAGNASESAKSKGSDDSENSFSRDLMDMLFGKKWKQTIQQSNANDEEDDGGFGEYRSKKSDAAQMKKTQQSSTENLGETSLKNPPQTPHTLHNDIPERLRNFYKEHLERLSQTTIGLTLPAFSSADSSPRTTPRSSTVFNTPLVFPPQDIPPIRRSRVSSDSTPDQYHHPSHDALPHVVRAHRPPPPPPDMSSRSISAPLYKHPPNPFYPKPGQFRPSPPPPEIPPRAPIISTIRKSMEDVTPKEPPKPGPRKLSMPVTPSEPYVSSRDVPFDTIIDENQPPVVINERLVDELPKILPPTSPKSPISRKPSKSPPVTSKPWKAHKKKTSTSSLDSVGDTYKSHNKKASVASMDAITAPQQQKQPKKSPLKENLSVPASTGSSTERLFSRYDPKRRGIRFLGAENEQSQFKNLSNSPKKQQLTATERLFNGQPLRRKPSSRENRKQKVIRRHTLSGLQDLQRNSPTLRFKSNLQESNMVHNLSMYDLASDSQGQRSAMERLNPRGATTGMTLNNWIVQERMKIKVPATNNLPTKKRDKKDFLAYV